MKQARLMMAIASVALGCGDDEPARQAAPARDAGMDASDHPDASPEGGSQGGAEGGAMAIARVTNVGATCATDMMCTGPQATCRATTSPFDLVNPGGSCSAVCTAGDQCGPNGNCPIGEAIAAFPPALTAPLGVDGFCTQACTLGAAGSCRPGYTCVTLNLLSRLLEYDAGIQPEIVPLTIPFCFPVPARGDGGAGASSSATGGLDGGLDASL